MVSKSTFIQIFALIILIVLALPISAKVEQSIDRQDISAGETFVLDLKIDHNTDSQPDLSLIPADFTIVSSSQYQHTQIINGSRSSVKGWKIKLKTLKTGKITLPAITIGNESSKPIELNIKDSSNEIALNGQLKAIFLDAKVSSEKIYVQQQMVFTISLYRAVQTHYASLTEPTAGNSIIEKLGDDTQFEKIIDNKRYIVTQRKYAIFPQESGDIEISPVTFTADVNDNNRRRSTFLNSTRPISVSTQPIKIAVKPKPANAPTPWLPAENVTLTDRWSPNPQSLKVGEPITWTVNLTVQGLSESQLPEINFPTIQGLQLYPDTPQKERNITPNGVQGQRIEKFAVIPSQSGEITIPEVKLQWWNTKTDSVQTAVLPPRTFNVLPSDNQQAQTPELPTVKVEPVIKEPVLSENNLAWKYTSAGLLLLWLLTLLAYFKKSPTVTAQYPTGETNKQPPIENAQSILKQLKQQANNNQVSAVEKLLIQLAQAAGFTKIQSLGSLKSLLAEQSLISKVQNLELMLYSSQRSEQLVELNNQDIEQIYQQLFSQRKNKGSQGIPPLYPR